MEYKKLKYDVDFLLSEQKQKLHNMLEELDESTIKKLNLILDTYVISRIAKTVGLSAIDGSEEFDIRLKHKNNQ